jgi:prepilin-type N-terminal cleavage/methylation domain-containing protein
MKSSSTNPPTRRAFTLIELMVVIAVVALIVFFVRRRNSKTESVAAMPTRSGDNGMVGARNDYGQLPGVKTYGDVADVRAIAANTYGNVTASPKGEYDAPDSPFTL